MYKTGLNIKTFEARVVLGLKVGYLSKETISLDDVKRAIEKSASKVDDFTFSGILTSSEIVVSGKSEYKEPAILIETSIYPRFPEEKETFKKKFTEFIGKLAVELKQERVVIRFTDESLMVETEYCKNSDIK